MCDRGDSDDSAARFVVGSDGARIAYDVTGDGPPVLLLHGGGQTRRVWHDLGYVARLERDFTVITMDLRGNGDSSKPEDVEAYAIDLLIGDVLAVVDAAAADRFALWGFSYGANIGRYVPQRSDRVRAMVYVGIPFGPAADGAFRTNILDLRTKWTPIIEAHRDGQLDATQLPEGDRELWQRGTVPAFLAALTAMLDYPPVEPGDMRCPTLWLVGTANDAAAASVNAHRPTLGTTRVVAAWLEGLTHHQELEQIDQTLPVALEFIRAHL